MFRQSPNYPPASNAIISTQMIKFILFSVKETKPWFTEWKHFFWVFDRLLFWLVLICSSCPFHWCSSRLNLVLSLTDVCTGRWFMPSPLWTSRQCDAVGWVTVGCSLHHLCSPPTTTFQLAETTCISKHMWNYLLVFIRREIWNIDFTSRSILVFSWK